MNRRDFLKVSAASAIGAAAIGGLPTKIFAQGNVGEDDNNWEWSDGIQFENVPDNVSAGQIPKPSGIFTVSKEFGKASLYPWFAEPGRVLFESSHAAAFENVLNELGEPKTDDELAAFAEAVKIEQIRLDLLIMREPTVDTVNPLNNFPLISDRAKVQVPEGGFTVVTTGYGVFSVGGVVMELPPSDGVVYTVVVRGNYVNGKKATDENGTLVCEKFPAGHAQTLVYRGGNGGFISEGHFRQIVGNTLNENKGNNCGAEGCLRNVIVALDVNTGAFSVVNAQPNGNNGNIAYKNMSHNW